MANQDPISRAIDVGRDVTEKGQKRVEGLLRDVSQATDRQTKQVTKAVDDLVRDVTRTTDSQTKQLAKLVDEQSKALSKAVEDLRNRSRENTERVGEVVEAQVRNQLNAMGLATRADVERLEKKVDALAAEVRKLSKGSKASGKGSKATAKKAAKKASKKPAKKAASRSGGASSS